MCELQVRLKMQAGLVKENKEQRNTLREKGEKEQGEYIRGIKLEITKNQKR